MLKQSAVALLLTLSLWPTHPGAQTSVSTVNRQSSQQAASDEDDVVRITTNLVQLDVTVTDRDGAVVADLKPEEFEIREDNRPQTISNFSFIPLAPAASPRVVAAPSAAAETTTRAPAPPPARLRPAQVRRTLALLVDDNFMSFASVGSVRDTLRKFISERVEADDLVGLFRTRRGNSMLQQFTPDQNLLALAVRRLVWIPGPDNAVDIFTPARREDEETGGRGDGLAENLSREKLTGPERVRAEYFRSNRDEPPVMNALRFLINDMRKLPGRKSIVVFSDGLPINAGKGNGDVSVRLYRQLRLLADYANRSGVTIHTIDARGLLNTDYIGADETPSLERTSEIRAARAEMVWEQHNGLNYLAEETGGAFTRNTNDIDRGLRRALEEQRGYYLIGYRPSDDTFREGVRGFRKLEVRVRRPGLRVRTRKGFVGITDDVLKVMERARTADSPLYATLASPLSARDVPLRLTPIFGQDAKGDPFLRVFLHIDAGTLNVADEANNWKRLTLDVAAVTFAQDGRVADEFTRTHTVRIGPDTFALVRRNGLIYSTSVPLKNPGAYQFRIVVRDAGSNRFGSASQFIDIPDLKKDALALSGLVVTEADPRAPQDLPAVAPVEAALAPVQFPSNPAVRRFRPGAVLSYAHLIYNARLANSTRRPQLTTQVRLFHEGREIFASPATALDAGQQNAAGLRNDGLLRLSPALVAGDYALQVVVTDQAAGKKPRLASQWIDFEVVR